MNYKNLEDGKIIEVALFMSEHTEATWNCISCSDIIAAMSRLASGVERDYSDIDAIVDAITKEALANDADFNYDEFMRIVLLYMKNGDDIDIIDLIEGGGSDEDVRELIRKKVSAAAKDERILQLQYGAVYNLVGGRQGAIAMLETAAGTSRDDVYAALMRTYYDKPWYVSTYTFMSPPAEALYLIQPPATE